MESHSLDQVKIYPFIEEVKLSRFTSGDMPQLPITVLRRSSQDAADEHGSTHTLLVPMMSENNEVVV